MERTFFSYLALTTAIALICQSCKKDISCEGCRSNSKPPIAVAGPDQIITLPKDSATLDGSASNDPDGAIKSYQWTKISGPVSIDFGNAASAKATARKLIQGAYELELTVIDDKGLSAKDTMQVIVNDPLQPNRPPVADAGPDQVITLPANTAGIDGGASTDPDNNIMSYEWKRVSGPATSTIANPKSVQTQLTGLVEGSYLFELTVTDAMGLFDKDTLAVHVKGLCPQPSNPPPCGANCGKIVFVSDRDGNNEIYSCNADGSNIARLTNDPRADGVPVWSPDGTRIAFCKYESVSSYGGNIFVMNSDGSNLQQLTFTGDANYPTWAPDGTKIAFTDMVDETQNVVQPTIKVIDFSTRSVLTHTVVYGASVIPAPAWAPDGTKIAFDSDWNAWDFVSDIFTICPDGGNFSELTGNLFDVQDYWKPAWSPNGAKISVSIIPLASSLSPLGKIATMNSDGKGLSVIMTDNLGEYSAVTKTSWSPDGNRIAYTSWGTNNAKTLKWVSADGSSSGKIIDNGWDADWKH